MAPSIENATIDSLLEKRGIFMVNKTKDTCVILGAIEIAPLLKAQQKFDDFRQHLNTEQEKAGAVQAFEYCFELCWKTLKRVLEAKAISVYSARDAFREGARNGYLSDPTLWFDFILKRNLSSHVYNEAVMEDVVSVFESFSKEMDTLIEKIKQTQ
jgi:nucleotidyltransferase substrate binding protein (TIGR01987 family)